MGLDLERQEGENAYVEAQSWSQLEEVGRKKLFGVAAMQSVGVVGSLRVVNSGFECHADTCGHSSCNDEEPVKAYKPVGKYFS